MYRAEWMKDDCYFWAFWMFEKEMASMNMNLWSGYSQESSFRPMPGYRFNQTSIAIQSVDNPQTTYSRFLP